MIKIFNYEKIISGYENFMKYLNDENEYIDQTYLWDIISSGVLYKNKYAQSFNIVLIKNENNDITNNLSIICPTILQLINKKPIIIYQNG